MDFEAALEHAINGEAILFAGAGFSVGAKNVNNQPLKTGGMLAEYFADATDLPADSRLEDAAEAFVDLCGDDRLIEVLHNEFTVQNVAGYHLELAKIPWKRIYTTNYDNVLETAYQNVGRTLISVSLSDNIRNLPKENPICVHLNGCVTRLDRETIRSEIKLTDTSYLTATVADSPWAAFFRQDLRLARAVFFVGYSLADMDIKRIVFDNEDLRLKTFFFLGPKPGVMTIRRARRFGTIINQMDTEALASTFAKKQESYKPTEPLKLVHYCYEKLEIADIDSQFSDDRLIDLLALGDVETEFVRRSIYRELPYYLERTKMDRLTELLKSDVRAIVVHSDLGNGKTLFLEGLKYRALEQGYEVYSLINRSEDICRETEQILRQNTRTLLVVENYYNWFDVLDYISMNWGQNTKLVLSARSAIYDVTIERLYRSLEVSNIPEITLDLLDGVGIDWIVDLLDEYGLWGEKARWPSKRKAEFVRIKCRSQFHAVLLSVMNAPQILERFKKITSKLDQNRAYYQIVVSILVFAVLGRQITLDLLYELWSSQMCDSRFRRDETIREIISFDSDRVRMRSAVAARYILKDVADPNVIVDTLIEMARAANRLSSVSRTYRDLRVDLMRFSNLNHILPEKGRRAMIIRYYESIKGLEGSRKHPLFWLQYAIACLTIDEFDRAEGYFETAYSLGKARNWNLRQIDNHYARFLLMKSVHAGDSTDCMTYFRKARRIIHQQITEEKRHYPYRVATLYSSFYETFAEQLSDKHRNEVFNAASYVLNRIHQLPPERRKNRYVRECEESMAYILLYKEELGSDS